jgi:amino acid transporter
MISPEVLMVVGNAAGRAGYWLACFVVFAGLIHMITTMAYKRAYTLHPNASSEVRLIGNAFGAVPALWVPLCARVTVTVCVSTALLATAGYVFNEVFFYWFPNLGFSFCLLGVLLLINLLGTRASALAQLVFVAVAIGGLVFLTLSGFFAWGNASLVAQEKATPLAHLTQIGLAGLLVFVGFDLAGFSGEDGQNEVKAMMGAILLAGVIFVCWGWVSTKYVTLGRLSDTSIPHVKTARAVLGQSGRIWMGIIILAGVSAAVNALLIAVSRMMANMATEGLLPSFMAMGKNQTNMGVLVLGVAVATMMAMGMAGEPILEIYMKAGLILWLILYAVILGSVMMMNMKTSSETHWLIAKGRVGGLVIGLAAIMWAVAGIFLLSPEWLLLLKMVIMILTIGLIFAVLWISFSKKRGGSMGFKKKLANKRYENKTERR